MTTDNTAYQALYLHIPFCAQRCHYCDFNTRAVPADDPAMDDYIDGLIREIRSAARDGLLADVRTLYIGGGTPSFLGHRRLVKLVYTLAVSMILHPETEFTIELNPESLTQAMARDLVSLGVTRFSIGVQSFDDELLSLLGRAHSAATAKKAIMIAQERISNCSIDLICGIPGQSEDSWRKTLATATKAGLAHVSVYPLSIEPDTALAYSVEQGGLADVDEDKQAQQMQLAAAALTAAGYQRYEVASYAKPGFECQHNIAYWTGLDYLGLGQGAAGMRNTAKGRQRLLNGQVIEELTQAQAAAEDLMLGMRLSRGVAVADLESAAQHLPTIKAAFAELLSLGLIEQSDNRYRPTQRGWLLGNQLYSRIWDCAELG